MKICMNAFVRTIVCSRKNTNRLKVDYNFLRGYYNDPLAEKDSYVVELRKVRKSIDRCAKMLSRLNATAQGHNSSAAGSDEDPVAPPGYEI